MTEQELEKITTKRGYRIVSSFKGPGIKSGLTQKEAINKGSREGQVPDMERSAGLKSVRPEDLTIPYSGQCVVRIKVYRRRLTDPGSDCWKYHLDALRYLGLLADDNDAAIRLEEEPHEKVESNEEERVELTIEYPNIDLNDLCEYYKNGPKNTRA